MYLNQSPISVDFLSFMMSSDNNTYLFRLGQNEALTSLNPNQVLFPIWNKLEAIHFHKLLVDESFSPLLKSFIIIFYAYITLAHYCGFLIDKRRKM